MATEHSALLNRLIRHEGVRLKPYRDTAGKLTIGVGRNLNDVGLRMQEAMFMLSADIVSAEAALDRDQPWWRKLDPVRRDVLIELAFNIGAAGLGDFKMFLTAMQANAFAAAAADLLASKWASQVGERAHELAAMVRTGVPS